MQKSGIILFVATGILQLPVFLCAPQTPPVDSTTVDLFVDYYMENVVYYFYSIAPLIESELNKISQLLDDSKTARDATKAKTIKYVRLYINSLLDDLKRRYQGCKIHVSFSSLIHIMRDLIYDAGDRQLLAEYNKHVDAIESAIDWEYYHSNYEKVINEIELACKANGFAEEYTRKLMAKLC